ncbi:MAG TPA: hypothetical protein VH008_11470 [Pseudonocardia sp.]|nr:hypothetical protein [Pseudonocardia sp.]
MSARLVTLAINISVMGILLATGILDSLRERLAGQLSGPQMSNLAAHVANGDSPATLRDTFPQLALLDRGAARRLPVREPGQTWWRRGESNP